MDKVKALVQFRLDQSQECLDAAERELDADSLKASVNRSYYCIFHAMRALLALDGFDSKKHSGIIAAFRKRYIKTGALPAEFSDIVGSAFEIRVDSDYQDFYVLSKADVLRQKENAKLFLTTIETYINRQLSCQ